MMYSGLDWSGSPGLDQGPILVFAIVHIEESDLPSLDQAVATARLRLGRDDRYAFKHTRVKSFPEVHREFYDSVRRVPWRAHVYTLEKQIWRSQQGSAARGLDCIRDGIVALVLGCPDSVVANQILFIDLPSQEERIIQDYRTSMRQALRGARRSGFKNVRPCPDHRQHGALIQVADMIAGEVREHGFQSGPFLPTLGNRIKDVE